MGVLGTAEWIQGKTGTAIGSWRSDRSKADGYMGEGGHIKRIWVIAEKHYFRICWQKCDARVCAICTTV